MQDFCKISQNITFGEYRALVGLLEHLRFLTHLEADATAVLYRPHGRDGESRDGLSSPQILALRLFEEGAMRLRVQRTLHPRQHMARARL